MTTARPVTALKRLAAFLAAELEGDAGDPTLAPEELYGVLQRPGGTVDLLHADRATIACDRGETILDRVPSRAPFVALDAGLTTPLEVTDDAGAHVVNMAAAASAGIGADIGGAISTASTNVAVVVSPDEDPELSRTQVLDGDVEASVEVVGDQSLRASQPRKLSTDYARGLAEGRHLHRLAQAVDRPVMVDGPVLPSSSILKDLVFNRIHEDDDGDPWDTTAGRATREYIRGFESLYRSGNPVVGVVKGSVSERLLNAIDDKTAAGTAIPWTRDAAFLDQLLRPTEGEPATYRYTPWFVENTYRTDVGDGHEVSLVEGLDTEFDSDDYRRAFFYVRSPDLGGTGTVMRIETLAGVGRDPARAAELQDLVLGEIVRTGDVPEPILRADRRARVSRERRIEILDDVGLTTVRNYDRDHRRFTSTVTGGHQ